MSKILGALRPCRMNRTMVDDTRRNRERDDGDVVKRRCMCEARRNRDPRKRRPGMLFRKELYWASELSCRCECRSGIIVG